MNVISDNSSLMDNFIFGNYHPFHLSCSSLSPPHHPYNNFLNEDSPSGLVSNVEAAALPTAVDEVRVAFEAGKGPQGTSECNQGAKNGKKKVEKPRKQRYAFQTRSHVDILDDGFRWRKYGQKAVKNSKFPRSYYRCTHQGCSVKKQVQRLTKDEGVIVTTYEGIHSHPIHKSTDNFEHILSQLHIYSNNGTTSS